MTLRRLAPALLAFALLLAACDQQKLCAPDQVLQGNTCYAVQTDPANCGTVGHACGEGEVCRAGGCSTCATACGDGQRCEAGMCVPDLYVACFGTDDVRGVTAGLVAAGNPVAVDDGPTALAWDGSALWVGHALGAPVVDAVRPGNATPTPYTLAAGGDLEFVRVHGGRVYVSNSALDTVVVIDPAASPAVVDEITLAAQPEQVANPLGLDFVGQRAYVALYGSATAPGFEASQQLAVVDFSTTPATLVKRISLDVAGAYDAGGFPFPSRVVAVGTKVYAILANLKQGSYGYYTDPAGSGRLAVVDTADGDALTVADLGAGCSNPYGLTADGTTLWIACGGSGAVLPVDVSGASPAVGQAVPVGTIVPGKLAICRGNGYVTDQYTGAVVRFALDGSAQSSADLCPAPTNGWNSAADIVCIP